MDKKSKIILVLLVITLLSLSSYASLSRFSKGINKEGSINTTELSYCGLNEIETLSECLIRNDSEQELSLALNTIDERTNNASDQSGLYKNEDDYTVDENTYTYYYHGNVNNNWVKFGNSLWRVIRINGDGTIRMIYSGLESSSHTGADAHIVNTSYIVSPQYTATTTDLFDSNNTITTTYTNGRYGTTYVGYMYNPVKEIATYPNKTVGSSATSNLNYFPIFSNTISTKNYYFFKNFNPQEDCFTGDGTEDDGACTLKCRKLGDDGDCIKSLWNDLAADEENYSTTASGVYPTTNPTRYVYTDDYKYTCWQYGTPIEKENADGTTSVYITCPIVTEIVGTMKDKQGQAIVKYHGLFSPDITTSNTNVLDSTVKQVADSWYENNIMNQSDENNHALEDYLSDEIFCSDRTSNSNGFPFTSGGDSYVFGPNKRISNPSFKCPNISNDGFTLKTSGTESRVVAKGNGNNMLNYPVGLITVDEVVFAGGKIDTINHDYYLYTGKFFWTMSPRYFYMYCAFAGVWSVTNEGELPNQIAANPYGVRPVINLKSDILYKGGNGTESNPYIIDINN